MGDVDLLAGQGVAHGANAVRRIQELKSWRARGVDPNDANAADVWLARRRSDDDDLVPRTRERRGEVL